MTTLLLGLLFCISLFVGLYWMGSAFERTDRKDAQYPKNVRLEFFENIRHRAAYAQQYGDNEITVTNDEFVKLMELDEFYYRPLENLPPSVFGCVLKILPEPIAPSRPGYISTNADARKAVK